MNKVYLVSEVNKYIKMVFEKNAILSNITIKGEITNFKAHFTGHLYFTVKDESSSMKCVMFKSFASLLKFKMEDGMKVNITGQIAVYEKDGSYQMYAKSISRDGIGDLHIAYEMLKKKLAEKGMFDQKYKKKIPFLPKRVGVITSKTGSVVRDIINVTTRRFDNVNLLIYPASTQGVNTASSVISGIEMFNKLNNVDVIIIARGGGSFEDLFGFNDEKLAETIFASEIPIVSAVGHETDFTICDFVSDLRAPTPSAAAELVYPDKVMLKNKIHNLHIRNYNAIASYIRLKREYVKKIKSKTPNDMITKYRLNIDKINIKNESIVKFKIEKLKNMYKNFVVKIDAMSPLKTMARGYSSVSSNNKLVKSIKDVKENDEIAVTLIDGKINAIVKG